MIAKYIFKRFTHTSTIGVDRDKVVNFLFKPAHLAQIGALDHKRIFLNPGFFYLRAVIYLVAWWWMGTTVRKLSIAQDSSGDGEITRKLRRMAPFMMITFAL